MSYEEQSICIESRTGVGAIYFEGSRNTEGTKENERQKIAELYEAAYKANPVIESDGSLNLDLGVNNNGILLRNALIFSLYATGDEHSGFTLSEADQQQFYSQNIPLSTLYQSPEEISITKMAYYLTTHNQNPQEQWNTDAAELNNRAIAGFLFHVANSLAWHQGLHAEEIEDLKLRAHSQSVFFPEGESTTAIDSYLAGLKRSVRIVSQHGKRNTPIPEDRLLYTYALLSSFPEETAAHLPVELPELHIGSSQYDLSTPEGRHCALAGLRIHFDFTSTGVERSFIDETHLLLADSNRIARIMA